MEGLVEALRAAGLEHLKAAFSSQGATHAAVGDLTPNEFAKLQELMQAHAEALPAQRAAAKNEILEVLAAAEKARKEEEEGAATRKSFLILVTDGGHGPTEALFKFVCCLLFLLLDLDVVWVLTNSGGYSIYNPAERVNGAVSPAVNRFAISIAEAVGSIGNADQDDINEKLDELLERFVPDIATSRIEETVEGHVLAVIAEGGAFEFRAEELLAYMGWADKVRGSSHGGPTPQAALTHALSLSLSRSAQSTFAEECDCYDGPMARYPNHVELYHQAWELLTGILEGGPDAHGAAHQYQFLVRKRPDIAASPPFVRRWRGSRFALFFVQHFGSVFGLSVGSRMNGKVLASIDERLAMGSDVPDDDLPTARTKLKAQWKGGLRDFFVNHNERLPREVLEQLELLVHNNGKVIEAELRVWMSSERHRDAMKVLANSQAANGVAAVVDVHVKSMGAAFCTGTRLVKGGGTEKIVVVADLKAALKTLRAKRAQRKGCRARLVQNVFVVCKLKAKAAEWLQARQAHQIEGALAAQGEEAARLQQALAAEEQAAAAVRAAESGLAAAVEEKEGGGGGAEGAAKRPGGGADGEEEEEEEEERIFCVQCERCEKWRRVPARYVASFPPERKWNCALAWQMWKLGMSCDDDEEQF